MTKPSPKRGRPKNEQPAQPGKPVRVRAVYLPPLKALAKRNGTSIPEEVNRMVREGLERAQLWPPASGDADADQE